MVAAQTRTRLKLGIETRLEGCENVIGRIDGSKHHWLNGIQSCNRKGYVTEDLNTHLRWRETIRVSKPMRNVRNIFDNLKRCELFEISLTIYNDAKFEIALTI